MYSAFKCMYISVIFYFVERQNPCPSFEKANRRLKIKYKMFDIYLCHA